MNCELKKNSAVEHSRNIPLVRFPEFEGEWEFKKGDEVFKIVSNKKHNYDLPILAISQEFGAIPRESIDYKINVTEKSISSYKVVEIGDFIINYNIKYRMGKALFGDDSDSNRNGDYE